MATAATQVEAPEREEVRRLRRAIVLSETRLGDFRKERRDFIARYCGAHYGGASGLVDRRPLNQIHALIMGLIPSLVSANPKAWIRAREPSSRGLAELLGKRVDRWAEEIKLVIRLRRLVLDGLVGPGIMWTGLAQGQELEFGDYWLDVGEIATKLVSVDDYCCDPHARHREEMYFEGHAYWLPVKFIQQRAEEGYYQNTDMLLAGGERSGEADEPGTDAGDLSKRQKRDGTDMEIEPMVQLRDLWIPRERQVWTVPAKGKGDLPLRIVDYDGPEGGPYDMLSFFDVPDNPFPLSPAAVIWDLDEAINDVGRKMIRQIERDKRVGLYENTDESDAERIRTAEDGDLIGVQHPEIIKEMHLGGASPETFGSLNWLIQHASEAGGNINVMGGRRTDEPTLGQSEILADRIGVRLTYMRSRLTECVRSVYGKVVWHVIRHEMEEMGLPLTIPGVPEPVYVRLQPEDWSELDPADLEVDIQPYSMTPDSPPEAADKMLKFLGITQPFIELLAAQGKTLNAEAIVRHAAKLYGIREIDLLFAMEGAGFAPVGPVPQGAGPQGQAAQRGGQRASPREPATQARPGRPARTGAA